VGVVGHRPNRLPRDKESLDTLRRMLRNILEDVKAELSDYAGSSPAAMPYLREPFVLRAVSPLAEGTDRIFAEEALDLGYELFCPMPFSQEEFEQDFLPPNALEPDSRERFRGLLKRAGQGSGVTTFELDGERSAAPKAYALAGRIVLNQSDLLIAVWDGHKPAGGGSTVGTTREALAFQSPVLWIDALEPNAWQMLRRPDDLKSLEENQRCVPQGRQPADPAAARKLLAETVRRVVREEIAPPVLSSETHEAKHGAKATRSPESNYFGERKPRFSFAIAWKLFRDAVGSTSHVRHGSLFQTSRLRFATNGRFAMTLKQHRPTRAMARLHRPSWMTGSTSACAPISPGRTSAATSMPTPTAAATC